MGKTVGLFRAIKQEWLNKTAELVIQGYDDAAIKSILGEYLSYEIDSEINLGKTRGLLMNIWARPEETSPNVHTKAIEAYRHESSDKAALSWALFVLAHPVFADAGGLIGKISMVQDTFTTSWLKTKLCELRGERPTLVRTTAGILETMKCLDCIEQEKIGVYRIKKHVVGDEQTISVLLMSLLALDKKAYYDIHELSRVPMFFPFEFDVSLELLHNSPNFALGNFGGKMVLSAAS
ncbi:hypothetical protein FACS1894167_08930 [Synergistales bacterium]|nr:hypothetical protein FACS1894167_08930 [Synergistales bacterium]